jgi:hypothetical protein
VLGFRPFLYVSPKVYSLTVDDGDIFTDCFPDGLPGSVYGHCLGDGHFAGCKGVISPPNLKHLKAAYSWGDREVNRVYEQIEGISFIRARVEHGFGLSGSAGCVLWPKRSRVGPLAPHIHAVFVLMELRALRLHGFGSVYENDEQLSDRLEIAQGQQTLARARYEAHCRSGSTRERRHESTSGSRTIEKKKHGNTYHPGDRPARNRNAAPQ